MKKRKGDRQLVDFFSSVFTSLSHFWGCKERDRKLWKRIRWKRGKITKKVGVTETSWKREKGGREARGKERHNGGREA